MNSHIAAVQPYRDQGTPKGRGKVARDNKDTRHNMQEDTDKTAAQQKADSPEWFLLQAYIVSYRTIVNQQSIRRLHNYI